MMQWIPIRQCTGGSDHSYKYIMIYIIYAHIAKRKYKNTHALVCFHMLDVLLIYQANSFHNP